MEQIIQEFLTLVQTDAASRDERRIADYMTARLQELGFTVHEDGAAAQTGGNAGNLTAFLPGTIPGCMMLSSHMDRVDRGYGVKPSFQDGYIVSDGTTILGADNVSGLASILDGLRRVLRSGQAYTDIRVVLSVCEEKGIWGARLMDPASYQAELGFVMDSSGPFGTIEVKRPFKAMTTIEVFGRSAHAGNAPENGINAITAAAAMLDGIRDGRIDEETTSNIGVIHGGLEEPGTVCDYVRMRCESRSQNEQKLTDYLSYLRQYCEERIAGTKATCKITTELQHRNYAYGEDDELVRIAMECLRDMGQEPKLEAVMGGCDGNIFANNGVPCISLGMGNENSHSLRERVHVQSLIQSGELVERLILKFAAYRAEKEA